MDIVVGQRWLYTAGSFYIVAEITQAAPVKALILQANEYADKRGYAVGRSHDSMGIDKSAGDPKEDWQYLIGQDKP